MKNLRVLLALTSLCALMATGCIIASGQILAHFDLPNPFTIDGADGFERVPVDLGDIGEYEDHKDKLKGLSDVAVVGKFTNENGPGGGVEIYITAGDTNLGDPDAIRAGATKLWGPGTIGAAPASRSIGWNESAQLFTVAGKKLLIQEALGDGVFTLYTIGTAGVDNVIRVDDGALVLTLSAGI